MVPHWLAEEWRTKGTVLTVACQAPKKRAHGRQERREVWALADAELNAYVGTAGKVGAPWPHLQQIVRLRRERCVKGNWSAEVSYSVSSLKPERANASDLLRMTRQYWGIENQLHWVRDVTFGEDGSQVRTGSAPQVCAALRNLVITLLRASGAQNLAAALRANSARPRAAVAMVLSANRP
jgi:hypothetical protein